MDTTNDFSAVVTAIAKRRQDLHAAPRVRQLVTSVADMVLAFRSSGDDDIRCEVGTDAIRESVSVHGGSAQYALAVLWLRYSKLLDDSAGQDATAAIDALAVYYGAGVELADATAADVPLWTRTLPLQAIDVYRQLPCHPEEPYAGRAERPELASSMITRLAALQEVLAAYSHACRVDLVVCTRDLMTREAVDNVRRRGWP